MMLVSQPLQIRFSAIFLLLAVNWHSVEVTSICVNSFTRNSSSVGSAYEADGHTQHFRYYKEQNIWLTGKGSFIKSKIYNRHVVRVSLCVCLSIAFKTLNLVSNCYKIRCEIYDDFWGHHDALGLIWRRLVITKRRACELLRCEQ